MLEGRRAWAIVGVLVLGIGGYAALQRPSQDERLCNHLLRLLHEREATLTQAGVSADVARTRAAREAGFAPGPGISLDTCLKEMRETFKDSPYSAEKQQHIRTCLLEATALTEVRGCANRN